MKATMGRVEVMPRFDSSFESRDPLYQDTRGRSSSEGNNSVPSAGSPLLTTMKRTTPTLPEEQVSLTEQVTLSFAEDSPTRNFGDQRRLSSSLPASTSIVEALFGPGLGPCWGDFSCTYNRIRGRLYATSQAVLFYTNLLGFERRICLLLRDIHHMELFRTTSLRFGTVDGETYIFKSFNDREQVLHLLSGLKILADKQQEERRQTQGTGTPSANARRSSERNAPQNNGGAFSPNTSLSNLAPPQLSFQPIPPPPTSNRRRAASDSILRLPRVESSGSVGSRNQESVEDTSSIPSDGRPGEDNTGEKDEEEETTEASLADLWKQALHPKSPPLKEIGIDGIVLSCDIDTFFQTFWADHAKYSLEYYQREYVKDQDIKLTGWDLGIDGYFRRTLQFRHPIQNSLGLGPSSADTIRQQKLRQYAGHGITLENKTQVSGIPAADSFYVQDHWVLEAHGENQVKLTVRYDTRFTKRSMFKSIISKSIRKETKEWMAGYVDMVQTVLAEKSSHAAPISRSEAPSRASFSDETQKLIGEALNRAYMLIAVISVAFFFLGIIACWNIYRLQRTLALLHSDFKELQVCRSFA